jgi:hypothetical protein
VLGSHRDELVGLGIVVVAALVALACWFGAAGPAGAAVDDGLGAATGLARYVLPLGLAAVGIALVRDRRSESRTRLAIGGVLLALRSRARDHRRAGGRPGRGGGLARCGGR